MAEDIKWRLCQYREISWGFLLFSPIPFPRKTHEYSPCCYHRFVIPTRARDPLSGQNFILSLVLHMLWYLEHRSYLSLTLNSSSCTVRTLLFLPATLLKCQGFCGSTTVRMPALYTTKPFSLNTLHSARCSLYTAWLPEGDPFVMFSLPLIALSNIYDNHIWYCFKLFLFSWKHGTVLISKSFIRLSSLSPLYGEISFDG